MNEILGLFFSLFFSFFFPSPLVKWGVSRAGVQASALPPSSVPGLSFS